MTFFIDRWRLPLVAAAGLLALTAAAGCGGKNSGGNNSGEGVAGLAPGVVSASPPAAASAPPVGGPSGEGRPRYRMDMSRAERFRLHEAYVTCLYDNGWPSPGTSRDRTSDRAPYQKASEACQSLEPLPVWEYDTNNPEAWDNVNKVVECARARGVKHIEATEPGSEKETVGISLGGTNNDSESIRKGFEIIPQCEMQLFGGVSK
jgi:hypothetical protein